MRIQLKRSNVLESGSAKAPLAEQVEYGELAVNYSAQDPVLFIKDSSNNVIRLTNREAVPPGFPDISNPDYQPGTIDDRYMPIELKNDWSSYPAP